MSKKKVLLRGVFINRDTNGEGVLKVGTTLIRVSTVMGIVYTLASFSVHVFGVLPNGNNLVKKIVVRYLVSKNVIQNRCLKRLHINKVFPHQK